MPGLRRVFSKLLQRSVSPRTGLRPKRRPQLEALEDRCLPAVNTITSGSLSGLAFVDAAGTGKFQTGDSGLSGVTVTLTGTSSGGAAIHTSTVTDAGGNYSFLQVQPGTYSLAVTPPNGFSPGSKNSITGITVASGQNIGGENFAIGGITPNAVSLVFFLAINSTGRSLSPTPGAGAGQGFSLDSANPLTNQSLSNGTTTFLDLSGNFLDPNTTNGTKVTFNTSQGPINVMLFDKDAPQTVTNFLDNIQAGHYTNGVFSRLSNLNQISPQTPPPTPFQVLQGGGTTVNADSSGNVTGFSTVTPFQPIQNESNDVLHPNALGTISMARTNSVNSAASEFFFNVTDNSQGLTNAPGNGFAVFGIVADSQSQANLQKFVSQYTPTNESAANGSFFALPLINGFTPASNFPTGATTADLALINAVAITTPPTGNLTYSIVGNSNSAAVTATLGSNTAGSNFSANQLKLVANKPGTAVITLQITDSKGESVTKQFTVTVA
jgi:cyclophilin family peptidyl-prolyl cis-trans isomerase